VLHVASLSSGIVEGFCEPVFQRSFVVVRVVVFFTDLGRDSLSLAKRATHDRMTVVWESISGEEPGGIIFLHIGDAFSAYQVNVTNSVRRSVRRSVRLKRVDSLASIFRGNPIFKRVSRSELYWTILVRSYIGLSQLIRLKSKVS
jgi:hypothetical protein